MKEFNTIKEYKVKINGEIFNFIQAGAAKELQFTKAMRHYQVLDKKFEKNEANDKDLADFDKYSDDITIFLKSVFIDDTEDNSKVNKWIDETPITTTMNIYKELSELASKE